MGPTSTVFERSAGQGVFRNTHVSIVPSPPRLHRVTLESNTEVAPSIYLLRWSLPEGDPLYFPPGQHVTSPLHRGERSIPRSHSILSSANRHDRISILITKVPQGFGWPYLTGLDPLRRPTLGVLAPLGRFVLHDPGDRTVVLVGTGVGFAPFVPLLERLRDVPPDAPVWLFYGARSADEVVGRTGFELLARVWERFHFVPVLSKPPQEGKRRGEVGHVEERIRARFPELSRADVYLCGSNRMVHDMQALVFDLHAAEDRGFVDRWGDLAD